MATLKICVRKKRSDGFWPVYIRVTHARKTQFIMTDKVVTDKYLSNGEVQLVQFEYDALHTVFITAAGYPE
jgi:hypothetical protein